MDQSSDNPAGNKLGASINEPNLVRAIRGSGYPLQGVVAYGLKGSFRVAEEWGYIDRDTKEHRSLDIFASKMTPAEGTVQPGLALLVECKRSINPYVFFRNVIDREILGFPKIGGLTGSTMFLKEMKSNRVLQTLGTVTLGLAELPFVRPGPPHCSAFAMATAQGDKVQMSGEDPYKSLILPLTKAMDHAVGLYQAGDHPTSLYPTIILAVAILDAPILVVDNPRDPAPALTPWVRVPRQEARANHAWGSHVYYVVDMVHADFLDQFISTHLIPFFDEFASRSIKLSSVLFKGGAVENLDRWRWDEVKPQS
ncbi:MAG: hypothetical protein WBV69_24735 [Candidatus Sulfotelmatobacter sp.]